jgi:hypothetical protein
MHLLCTDTLITCMSTYIPCTHWYKQSGAVVIADLTDPMLPAESANSIFQILLQQFCSVPRNKLAVFDEAHKYLTPPTASSSNSTSTNKGLVSEMVSTFRQNRHRGIRMLVSTQNPAVLSDEMLDLVTVAVVHKFHSRDWYNCLQRKLNMNTQLYDTASKLTTGQALVYASRSKLQQSQHETWHCVQIRARLTCDSGGSIIY